MAETTDRPQVPGQLPPDAVLSGASLAPSPPLSAETYQPLSLLAMTGFGLAIAYTLIVVAGGLLALFTRTPWLMPYWTFLIPLVALVLCWAARTRIRDSDGTLSGLAFTTWGVRLTIVVGFTYAAYYGVTFFVVRMGAAGCAERLFEQLERGSSEEAFLVSQGVPVPSKGMDKGQMRDMVEGRFNQASGRPGMPGPFTRFRKNLYFRLIEMGGEQTNTTLVGVSEWTCNKEGYKVVLQYHVATPLGEFDLKLETLGRDPKPDETKGKKWQVRLTESDSFARLENENLKLTSLGQEFVGKRIPMARGFAQNWIDKINNVRWDEAYLDTLERSQRAAARKEQKADQLRRHLESGQLIHPSKTFWAGKHQRDAIEKRVSKTFQLDPSGKPAFNLILQQQIPLPLLRESAGRSTILFDVIMNYLDTNTGQPQYTMDGQLVVSAESSEAGLTPSAWRVESVELDSGRTAATSRQEEYRQHQRGMTVPGGS
ncbi:MAG: hypothetical protein ACYC3I_21670 [Gemmataceae bacterium]